VWDLSCLLGECVMWVCVLLLNVPFSSVGFNMCVGYAMFYGLVSVLDMLSFMG